MQHSSSMLKTEVIEGWEEDLLTLTMVGCTLFKWKIFEVVVVLYLYTSYFTLTSSCLRLISAAAMTAARRHCNIVSVFRLLKVVPPPFGKISYCCKIVKFIASLQDSWCNKTCWLLTLRYVWNFTWSTKPLAINNRSSINHASFYLSIYRSVYLSIYL